jgi:hypothetical protein
MANQPVSSQTNRELKEEDRLAKRLEDERTQPETEASEREIDQAEHSNPSGAPVPVEDLTGDLKKESRAKAERMVK